MVLVAMLRCTALTLQGLMKAVSSPQQMRVTLHGRPSCARQNFTDAINKNLLDVHNNAMQGLFIEFSQGGIEALWCR